MAVVLCRSNGKALPTPPGLRGAPRVTIKNEPVSTVPSHHGKKITARSAKHYACAEPQRKVVWKENFERFALCVCVCVCVVCVCVCVCGVCVCVVYWCVEKAGQCSSLVPRPRLLHNYDLTISEPLILTTFHSSLMRYTTTCRLVGTMAANLLCIIS